MKLLAEEDDRAKARPAGDGDMPAPFAEASFADRVERIAHDDRPTVLIVGAGAPAEAMVRWAERAGLRCVGRVGLEGAAERLARMAALDLVLLDLRGIDVPARLGRATARALVARYGLAQARLAVIADLHGLDCALALLDAPETEFLCDPAVGEIVSLLVMAGLRESGPGRVLLHDASRDSETARIEQLSEEVRRLASTIERLSQAGVAFGGAATVMDRRGAYRAGSADAVPDPGAAFRLREGERPPGDWADEPTHAEIRTIIRARRQREQFLPAELFADPAWDMILDLLAARLAGQRVSVSSLCIAAAVPPTTALRWIRQLTDRAVFARIDDPADGRRVFIELTEAAAQAVLAWVRAVRRGGGLLCGARR